MHYIPQVWQSPQNLTTEQLTGGNNGLLRCMRELWPLTWGWWRFPWFSTRSLLLLGRTIRRTLLLAGLIPRCWLYVRNLFRHCQRSKENHLGRPLGQLIMCHTLPRIGYKSPYNRRVESRDSEEGEAGRPKGSPPIVATYSHSWKRSSAPVVKSSGEVSLQFFFLPPF